MNTMRMGPRASTPEEYARQRARGTGTAAAAFRLGERVTGTAPPSKPASAASYGTAALDERDKDRPPAKMPKDVAGLRTPAAGPTPASAKPDPMAKARAALAAKRKAASGAAAGG